MSVDTTVYMENATSENLVPLTVLTVDSVDGAKFTDLTVERWSDAIGLRANVVANGIIKGGEIAPVPLTDDAVSITGLSCNLNKIVTTVAGSASTSLTRATTASFVIINSITVTAGGAFSVVVGTEGAAFSTTFDAAGGPPYIDDDAILVGNIYLTDNAAAQVTAGEIRQGLGREKEMAFFPGYEVIPKDGAIIFDSALPLIHSDGVTDGLPKTVYAEYAEFDHNTTMILLGYTDSFKVTEKTYSGSATNFHNGQTLVNISNSLVDGSFDITFKQDAGIGSLITASNGNKLWFKVYPDKNRTTRYLLVPPSVVSSERDAITAEASTVKATVSLLADDIAIEVIE